MNPQLYSIRRFCSKDREIMVFDAATFKNGVVTVRRVNEQILIYASTFEPWTGDPDEELRKQLQEEAIEFDEFTQAAITREPEFGEAVKEYGRARLADFMVKKRRDNP